MSNPELMVIGDSLAQGCRSLSVTKAFCEQSAGARIAASQGWAFSAPDHPRPVLFDLEKHIRRFSPLFGPLLPIAALGGFLGAVRRNTEDWHADFTGGTALSGAESFDNLGVAGATIPNLLETTAEDARKFSVDGIASTIAQNKLKSFFDIAGDLHYNVNACFTLNPSQKKNHDRKTQVEWAYERKPRRLIVQVGHNHGLFNSGFLAKYDLVGYDKLTRADDLAEALAKLPSDVREIYYFLLPKVSAVANLQPKGKSVDGYAEYYRPVASPSASRLTGEQMRRVDASVRQTNDEIRERFTSIFEKVRAGNSSRLTFIDAYSLFDRFDVKNFGESRAYVPAGGKRINNRYLDGGYDIVVTPKTTINRGTKLLDGGFQSFDGMHPSGVGYAQVAIEIMSAMGLTCDQKRMLDTAFRQDRLLSGYPMELEGVVGLLAAIQGVLPKPGDPAPAPTNEDDTPLAYAMSAFTETFLG